MPVCVWRKVDRQTERAREENTDRSYPDSASSSYSSLLFGGLLRGRARTVDRQEQLGK